MKIKNINPQHNDFRVPILGNRFVKHEEVVDVPDDVAALLLIQFDNWEPVDASAKKLADSAIADQDKVLAAASLSPLVSPPDAAAGDPTPSEPSGGEDLVSPPDAAAGDPTDLQEA